jgi:hypothetical protein
VCCYLLSTPNLTSSILWYGKCDNSRQNCRTEWLSNPILEQWWLRIYEQFSGSCCGGKKSTIKEGDEESIGGVGVS